MVPWSMLDDDSNTESGFTESDGAVTETNLAAIYVISTECDDAYENGSWEYDNACIIHRLCVSPDYQNKGIGKKLLNKIEDQLADEGFWMMNMLEAFLHNPHRYTDYIIQLSHQW